MSVTNAVSSVAIIVGALIAAGPGGVSFSKVMGFVAVTLASVNIFGGFIVTQRACCKCSRRNPEEDRRKLSPDPRSPSPISSPASCFIMALRGLSSPVTARGGNLYGLIGMVIAIGTTLASPGVVSYGVILLGIVIGGAIGTFIALKIQMTALPQLVAAFHSLVGLAAVCVATAAFFAPADYNIGVIGAIHRGSLVEMSLGTAIGAITFTGSIVAFAKLQGLVTGSPLVFPGQHPLNALIGIALGAADRVAGRGAIGCPGSGSLSRSRWRWDCMLIVPIGGADMPVVISMLNSYSGWAACGIGFTLANSAHHRDVARSSARHGRHSATLHHVQGHEPLDLGNVILGGFGTEGGARPRLPRTATAPRSRP